LYQAKSGNLGQNLVVGLTDGRFVANVLEEDVESLQELGDNVVKVGRRRFPDLTKETFQAD
jgi:hypothetical protein